MKLSIFTLPSLLLTLFCPAVAIANIFASNNFAAFLCRRAAKNGFASVNLNSLCAGMIRIVASSDDTTTVTGAGRRCSSEASLNWIC
jgi:hypothetical protein